MNVTFGARVPLLAWLLVAAAAGVPRVASAQAPSWMRGLDELMSVEVSSVSRKEQRLADTSAAAYVLTRDDIRRSGMRTVADVLRLVPGLHVAQIDGNKWAVTARGMNGRYASKLLVMIDGRSIYTPYHAGVTWDAVDVPVHIIERIEVIRGPGASIWGANAVNGVINIITSGDAVRRETVASAGFGSTDFGTILHEGRAGDRIGYRLFADAAAYDSTGATAEDRWRQQRWGGSMHATLNNRDTLDVSGRASTGRSDSWYYDITSLAPFTRTTEVLDAESDVWNASARWTRQLANQGHIQVEGFVDEWWRIDELDHHRRTYDIGLQHRLGTSGRHDLLWGAAYRQTDDTTIGGLELDLSPADYRQRLASTFLQDEIAIAGERGHVTLGTKVERRDLIGWNAQPTARLHWRFTPRHAAWGAVSRAMRAPDRLERSIRMPLESVDLPGGLQGVVIIHGSPDAKPEWLTAYEAGYRVAIGGATTLDVATYYNSYRGLRTSVQHAPKLAFSAEGRPYMELPRVLTNLVDATTAGGEVVATYAPQSFWRLTGSYSLFSMNADAPSGISRVSFEAGSEPRHQGQVRASVSLPGQVDLDVTAFATDAIPDYGVRGWARVDARIGWRPGQPLELSLVVQNVLNHEHFEYGGRSSRVIRFAESHRAAHGGITWRF